MIQIRVDDDDDDGHHQQMNIEGKYLAREPLSLWTEGIEELTQIEKDRHISQVYTTLLQEMSSKEFMGKLFSAEKEDESAKLTIGPPS